MCGHMHRVLKAGLITLTFISLCIAVYYFNPMTAAFLVRFDIVNSSGTKILVTPIGKVLGSGLYGPLPRYQDKFPPIIKSKQTVDIPVAPGQKLSFTYSHDDINFRYMLLRSESGEVFLLQTDVKGTENKAYGPQKTTYTIPPFKDLQRAPLGLLPCLRGEFVSYSPGSRS
jgi:hypothetical protein